ncbi:MAG TPA: four helix bundle protein [Chitinophagaceae bacterium]|nr:four helix bundle protein [Chitinophagaceae bacterium]
MATITKFEDIKAWQKARFFCRELLIVIENTPLLKDYRLRDQISASSGSVMDNIAEGYGRGGNAEFIQFLEISHASACEAQSQLYRLLDKKYIDETKFEELYTSAEEIKRMLRALVRYLSASGIRGPKYKLR